MKSVSRTSARARARGAARDPARHREGEPARAARRHARRDAAPGRARVGAQPPAHHHRFQRGAARAHHRRARRRGELPRGADRDPPGGLPADRRRAAVVREHAVRSARGRRHSHRPLRPLQRRPGEDRLSHRPRVPLWPAHADHLRHPLQLLPAGALERRVLRADPQLPAPFVAAAVPLRRLARSLRELRRRPRARPRDARPRDAGTPLGHVAAHGAARLPERRAGLARGELQQPRELRRVAAGRAHPALAALRGDRRPRRGRRVPPARHEPAADRERVLRHDPSQARSSAPASGRCTRCASAASSTSRRA